jgi:hypothetical protein
MKHKAHFSKLEVVGLLAIGVTLAWYLWPQGSYKPAPTMGPYLSDTVPDLVS